MKLLDKISQELGVFIDPNVSFKKQMDALSRGGQLDIKGLTKITTAVVEYLVDKDRTR